MDMQAKALIGVHGLVTYVVHKQPGNKTANSKQLKSVSVSCKIENQNCVVPKDLKNT